MKEGDYGRRGMERSCKKERKNGNGQKLRMEEGKEGRREMDRRLKNGRRKGREKRNGEKRK